jgi:putative ABC transport system ATP-binding protein
MLKLQNIVKSFPQVPLPALRNINISINNGDYCIILGSNGSGKSTLLKTISGEYTVDSGKITLCNRDITKKSMHLRASYISSVSQNIATGTIQEMTLLENLALSKTRGMNAGFKFFKLRQDEILENIKRLNLGLEKYLHCTMSSLSGGQRQSIATLMAMNPSPSLLLLDEHTSALDPHSKEKIMLFTDSYIKKFNITTLMITHNMHDALRYGTRLIIMHHGQIIQDFSGIDKSKLSEQEILDILHKTGSEL